MCYNLPWFCYDLPIISVILRHIVGRFNVQCIVHCTVHIFIQYVLQKNVMKLTHKKMIFQITNICCKQIFRNKKFWSENTNNTKLRSKHLQGLENQWQPITEYTLQFLRGIIPTETNRNLICQETRVQVEQSSGEKEQNLFVFGTRVRLNRFDSHRAVASWIATVIKVNPDNWWCLYHQLPLKSDVKTDSSTRSCRSLSVNTAGSAGWALIIRPGCPLRHGKLSLCRRFYALLLRHTIKCGVVKHAFGCFCCVWCLPRCVGPEPPWAGIFLCKCRLIWRKVAHLVASYCIL